MAGILAAVLRMEPDWSCLPETTPPLIRHLLRRCLCKDRRQRFQDATDVRIEIEDVLAAPKDSGATQAAPASTNKLLMAVGAVAATLAVLLVLTSWVAWRATRPAELKPLVRLDVDLGPEVSLSSQRGTNTILSPDGTRIVYVSQGRLFSRRLDQPNATELAGTQGAYSPFFSPDGQWIAFFAQAKLKKISVEGGAAIVLCDTGTASGGSWGEDGNIIARSRRLTGLSRIPSAGGPPSLVTELQRARSLTGGRKFCRVVKPSCSRLAQHHWVRWGHRRSDIFRRPPQENSRAGRHVPPIFAQRSSNLYEPRHAVCCALRSGSA